MSCAEALRRCPQAVFVRPRHSLYREYSRSVWETVRGVVPTVEQTGASTRATSTSARSRPTSSRRASSPRRCRRRCGRRRASRARSASRRARSSPRSRATRASRAGSSSSRRAGSRVPRSARRAPAAGRRAEGRGAAARRRHRDDRRPRRRSRTRIFVASSRAASATMLRDRARGIDPRELELDTERISISVENTFERDISDRERLHDELRGMATEVADALQRQRPGRANGDDEAPLRRLLDPQPLDVAARRESTPPETIADLACQPARPRPERPAGRAAPRRRRRLRPRRLPPARARDGLSSRRPGGHSQPGRGASQLVDRRSPTELRPVSVGPVYPGPPSAHPRLQRPPAGFGSSEARKVTS